MPDLRGRVAIVTGTAQGIGSAIAAALTEHGAMVAREVLAVDYAEGRPDGQAGGDDGRGDPAIREHADAELGLTFWFRRASAEGA